MHFDGGSVEMDDPIANPGGSVVEPVAIDWNSLSSTNSPVREESSNRGIRKGPIVCPAFVEGKKKGVGS
jgi:hypothetical protein